MKREKGILRRFFLIFIVIFIGFACVTNTVAQKTPPRARNAGISKKVPSSEAQAKPRVERKRLSGTVVSVNIESKTLVVKNWRGETTFDVAGAKLVRSTDLEDIRSGDRVVMSYAEEGGRNTAKALIATPAKREGENKTETSKETKPLTEEPRKK